MRQLRLNLLLRQTPCLRCLDRLDESPCTDGALVRPNVGIHFLGLFGIRHLPREFLFDAIHLER